MKLKNIIIFFLIANVYTITSYAQNALPYVANNNCLDKLIAVNSGSSNITTKNMVVADLNNDGIKEVVISNVFANIIKVYSFIPSTGTFSFQNSISLPELYLNGMREAVDVGYFTGDGLVDLIFTTDSSIFIYKNNSNYNFSFYSHINIPSSFKSKEHYLKVDNINNNASDDFYLISSKSILGQGIEVMPYFVFSNTIIPQPTQTIFKSVISFTSSNSIDVSFGDIDKNGLNDLMITCNAIKDSACFLKNTSSLSTAIHTKINAYISNSVTTLPDFSITSSEIADLNNDTNLDFIFYGNSISSGEKAAICVGFNLFSLFLPITVPISDIKFNDIKIKDINGDNISDFVGVGTYTSTSIAGAAIYLGNSNPLNYVNQTPILITFTNTNIKPDELQITDVDNNGAADIVFKPWKFNSAITYMLPNFSHQLVATATPSAICGLNTSTLSIITPSLNTSLINNGWITLPASSTISTNTDYSTNIIGDYQSFFNFKMYSASPCFLISDTVKIITKTVNVTVSATNPTYCFGAIAAASASGATTYTWLNTSNNPVYIGQTFTVQPNSTTTYSVVGEENGCKGTNTLSINMLPPNNDNIITTKNMICVGDSVMLSFPSATSYTWNNNNSNPTITISPIITSNYQLTLLDIYNCFYTKTITIYIDPNCSPIVYTGITVNGDGNNDVFTIDNIENYKNNSVTIFNRWGQKIFATTNYNNKTNFWPTKEQLNNLAPSTYFYIVNFGNGNEVKGWVELITN